MTFRKILLLCSLLCVLNSQAASFDEVTQKAEQIQKDASQLDAENCGPTLQTLADYFEGWMPTNTDGPRIRAQGTKTLQSLFKARVALHSRLEGLPPNCVASMRTVFRNMRLSEDMIGVVRYGDTQIKAEDIQFDKQPVPLLDAARYRPYQLNAAAFGFRKGDIMITKGVSVISSTISAIPAQPSVFSHIVFVYQDKDGSLGTIESYIGKGVSLYPMKVALQNENARILLLRAKDQPLAQAAHDYMLNRVRTTAASGRHIPYDYVQDFASNDHLSCEEIAYDAFNTASRGAFVIPSNASAIELKDEQFLKSAGLRNGPMMVPADMEVDPRFEIVLDWTDYRLVRDSWRKDAVLHELLRWINDEHYVMHNTFKAKAAELLWKTRSNRLLWPVFSKLSGIPRDFEREVPGDGLALMTNLKALGDYLVPKLAEADRRQFDKTGRWMNQQELASALNQLRIADKALYGSTGSSRFHSFFRPAQ